MAGRAMWRGVLRIGDQRVPVKLYAAAQDRKVHFHLLHDTDQVRVRQHMVDPNSGDAVPGEQITRGFEAEPGVFVLVRREDLDAVKPAESRDVELAQFVDADAIDLAWYERPYYLGPDGDPARYAALAEALRKKKQVGIAHWVMRGKRYAGALRPEGDQLVLVTLRTNDEVIDVSELKPPKGRELDKRERALAEQLISGLAGSFDPSAFRDEHRDRVRELIERKRKGGRVTIKRAPRKAAPSSLADALQKSVKRIHKEQRSA